MIIRQNIIQNVPITVEDIDIAENIFGPDMTTLKGRTTRQRKKVVVDDFIEIPIELVNNNQELILFMYIMFINQQALFTKIDKDIWFYELVPLENIIKEYCYVALDVVMRHYNKAVSAIKVIECDDEFKSITDEVRDDMVI